MTKIMRNSTLALVLLTGLGIAENVSAKRSDTRRSDRSEKSSRLRECLLDRLCYVMHESLYGLDECRQYHLRREAKALKHEIKNAPESELCQLADHVRDIEERATGLN